MTTTRRLLEVITLTIDGEEFDGEEKRRVLRDFTLAFLTVAEVVSDANNGNENHAKIGQNLYSGFETGTEYRARTCLQLPSIRVPATTLNICK